MCVCSCSITPDQLAETYCYLDLIGVIIGTMFGLCLSRVLLSALSHHTVMLAYVWLRIFETKEEVILNQNTGKKPSAGCDLLS